MEGLSLSVSARRAAYLWPCFCNAESAEASMHSSLDGPNSYRVGVSGRDSRELFFVEKTMFQWTDSGEWCGCVRIPMEF
jgi:hypothetical protein